VTALHRALWFELAATLVRSRGASRARSCARRWSCCGGSRRRHAGGGGEPAAPRL